MLSIQALCKRVGGRTVLDQATLDHSGPGVVWLRGENGCGKSTLLKCVVGLWRPDAGDVRVQGRSTVHDGEARRELGYVPDVFAPFPDLSVAEMLTLVAALKRSPPVARSLIERLGVGSFLHQGVTRLSAGQTRRAALLAALIGDPWLLVLDEPTTGLDVGGVALLRDLLFERSAAGQACLLVTHDAAFAEGLGAVAHDLVDGALVSAGAASRSQSPPLVGR